MQSNGGFVKIHIQSKKIFSKVVVLDYNQVYSQILFYVTFIYVLKSKSTTKEIWMQACSAWEFFYILL